MERGVQRDTRLHVSSFGVRFAAHAFLIEDARLRLMLVGMLGAKAKPGQRCCDECEEQTTSRQQNTIDGYLWI